MVESLKELNQICQKPRYREVGNWMVRHLVRDAALPFTWILLHTPVTANQVTAFSLFAGLLGIVLLGVPGSLFFFAGCFFIQFWYLLDHVDGQIARYRKTVSLSGRFFDFMTHHVIHGTVFFGLGFCLFNQTGNSLWILWGFSASLAMILFNLIPDTKYKTFLEALDGKGAFEFSRSNEEREEKEGSASADTPEPGIKKVFSFLHKMCEMHVLMNVLTVSSLFEVFSGGRFNLRLVWFSFYGAAAPVLSLTKIYYLISQKKVDDEFRTTVKKREQKS